jgi:hypothetical protein
METARLLLGTAVTVWLPNSLLPAKSRARFILLCSAGYSLYITLHLLSNWKGWTLLPGTVIVAVAFSYIVKSPIQSLPSPNWPMISKIVGRAALLVTLGAVVVFVDRGTKGIIEIAHFVAGDNIAVVISGFLIAVFCGNDIVVILTRSIFIDQSDCSEGVGIGSVASKYVGWLERALVFALIVGGQPSAAALAITAKSLARVPDLQQHQRGLAEYFLVGTLSSVIVALGTAIIVRLSLGLDAL